MTTDETGATEDARERALDGALARVLSAPALPAEFHTQLQAALVRAGESASGRANGRARLEREQRERLAELEAGYLRLRRRTLGTLIGGAFAAGAAVAVALPWLKASFGPNAIFILAALGALAGLAIGTASWLARAEAPNPLERLSDLTLIGALRAALELLELLDHEAVGRTRPRDPDGEAAVTAIARARNGEVR